jgi:hypothetical protein
MAIQLTTTKQAAELHGVKILTYGGAGAGKTRLCATAPQPVIISAEAGLLSLRQYDIPVITVGSIDEVGEAYAMLAGDEGKQFDSICLDSISEIAETCLTAEKASKPDPRQAYGEMADRMTQLVRAFRDLPEKHVYISAKQDRQKDDTTGGMLYGPATPGQKLASGLPYLFDEVFCLRVETDADGNPQRWLQTQPDQQFIAKDRSGALNQYEPPDLAAVINKIIGTGAQAAAA